MQITYRFNQSVVAGDVASIRTSAGKELWCASSWKGRVVTVILQSARLYVWLRDDNGYELVCQVMTEEDLAVCDWVSGSPFLRSADPEQMIFRKEFASGVLGCGVIYTAGEHSVKAISTKKRRLDLLAPKKATAARKLTAAAPKKTEKKPPVSVASVQPSTKQVAHGAISPARLAHTTPSRECISLGGRVVASVAAWG